MKIRSLAFAGALFAGAMFLLPATGVLAQEGKPADVTVYQVDPVHSSVNFKIQHGGAGLVWGRFNDLSGKVAINSADVAKSQLEFEVKVDSVDTNAAGRDKHLKTPDFFDAAKYPTITFKSTAVKALGEDNYEVTGNLTLMGTTKPVTAKFTKTGEGKSRDGKAVVGAEAEFKIKRSEFGMNKMLGGIGDDVTIYVAVEAGA